MYTGQSKSIWILKDFCAFESVLNKIVASDVFNYEDSKSESWHSAKEVRKVFVFRPRHLFCNEKLCFHLAELLYKYKNNLKSVKREKVFENFARKISFFLICIKLS